MAVRHRLGSSYRLQLNGLGAPGEAFARAAELVPFLHDLGVETCYLSPIATAMPGSTHGYDVTNPTAIDPALGGPEGFEGLLRALADHQMSALLDIVPNHQAANPANPYFADVLLRGRRSQYAAWFDVQWERADGRIVLPVIDGALEAAIDRGTVRIERAQGAADFAFRVGEAWYPAAAADSDDLALLTELAGADPRQDRAVAREIELLLGHQHYRLVDWRTANHAINYRRFFAINELIGIRQEDPEVFAATHSLVASLAADHRIAGFRVDHVDGMRDPAGYLSRLRDLVDGDGSRHVIEVEKILARDETLPDWPVEGTTGYEVAGAILGVLLDPAGVEAVAAEQAAATGDLRPFEVRAVAAKHAACSTMFDVAVDDVVRAFAGIGIATDFDQLRGAVEALTARLPVYRTYRAEGEPPSAADLMWIRAAAARTELSAAGSEALDKVVAVLAGPLGTSGAGWRAVRAWQQITSAVVAKGVEDTATFDAGTLLAGCEVGIDPGAPSWTAAQWHEAMALRARNEPVGMNAGSTHDSKRSLDLRCRLAVLSEVGPEWPALVAELDAVSPDALVGAAARRYLYQTLIGAWPLDGVADAEFLDRIREHLVKAAREAAIDTTWAEPDQKYETAYQDLVGELVEGTSGAALAGLAERIGPAGATNSLAAVVLGATAPGVPDTYQGDDLWSLALTDPDNRRPVDWVAHRDARSAAGDPSAALAEWRSGSIKQHVLRRCLQLRGRLRDWWDAADYQPIAVRGSAAEHVLAFARRHGDEYVVTVVSRLPYTLAGPGAFPVGAALGSTELDLPTAAGRWHEVLSDRPLPATDPGRLAAVLGQLPVAVLTTA